MGTPNYPKDMASEWNQLKRDVRNAFTSSNLRTGMAKIGAKVIEITGQLVLNAGALLLAKYRNGVGAFRVGESFYNGLPVGQVSIKRYDGSTALQVFGGEGVDGFFSIHDRGGNIIFSDDGASGQGIGRPHLPYTWQRYYHLTTPVDLATSTSFATHHVIFGQMQHPRIQIMGYVQCNGSDLAEVRIINGSGTVIDTSGTVGSGWIYLEGPHDDYDFAKEFSYNIDVRRVSGTSTGVGFTIVKAEGRQT